MLSALCGVGGSTIKGPILLWMGLNPVLAKSTSQIMLVTTSSAVALRFYLLGMIPQHEGVALFVCGFVGGIIGKELVDRIVKRTGRQSLIVRLLGWYIVFAAFAMAAVGALFVASQMLESHGKEQRVHMWFRGPCQRLPPDRGSLKWIGE